jgi:prophage regulatory protein
LKLSLELLTDQVLLLNQKSESDQINNPNKIIRPKELKDLIGLSIPTIWRMCQEGLFPKPLKLGGNSTGWRYEDVQSWINSRRQQSSSVFPHNIDGQNNDKILKFLAIYTNGLTQSEITRKVFQGNKTALEINQCLEFLLKQGLIQREYHRPKGSIKSICKWYRNDQSRSKNSEHS